MDNKFPKITGVVLAGGQARRMGGQDKGLIEVAGKPLVEYAIASMKEQLENIVINANRNKELYSQYGFPVVSDSDEGFNGPLAGMASCMKAVNTKYLLTVPCDSPLLPGDLVSRMLKAFEDNKADIAVADSGGRMQPVFSLISCSLLDSLTRYLENGERKIDIWFQQHALVSVDFSDIPDTFINVNTPEDIKMIESRLGK
jgi:molybdopterin-guanine dinucleotide biosynthesis protein A